MDSNNLGYGALDAISILATVFKTWPYKETYDRGLLVMTDSEFVAAFLTLLDIMVIALGVFGVFEYYCMRLVISPDFYVHTWDIQLQHLSGFLYVCDISTVHR